MKDRKTVLLMMGEMCKHFRETRGLKQSEVAKDTGYSEQNISSFETGRTNNMILLLWYVDKGLFDMQNRTMLRYLMGGNKK